jgi:HK97 family phage major capsid protein
MPSIQVGANALKYIEETTRTANAAPVAEGATKPESARAYTERTVLIEVIAALLPVSEQQLDDVPMIMALINSSLGMEVELAEEDQLLTGNGTSPQLQGFLTKTGVQTGAVAGGNVLTSFMSGLTAIRFTGFAEPSAAVWHPNDWQDVVTLQDADGRYIFGDPSTINTKQIWGVPAVVTPAETENTVLIGDFRMYAYVARRMGLRIDVGYVNDNFAKNLKTIRAESRLGLVIRRPGAFYKLTGA